MKGLWAVVIWAWAAVTAGAEGLPGPKIPLRASDLVVRLEVPPTQVVRLSFTGDLMAHNASTRMDDFAAIYRQLEDLLKADDLTFANLETPVDDSRVYSAYPSFNVHSEYVEAALKAGIEVFSLANNHANDFALPAMQGTLKALDALAKKYPLNYSGLKRRAEEPWQLEIIRKGGLTIGFLSATNLLNQWTDHEWVNYIGYYDYESGEAFEAKAALFLGEIKRLRPQVDLLILGLHDGMEYVQDPAPQQLEFYEDCLVAGVDILWAHHPHVLLPWYKVWKNGRFKVILSSMGNFVSGQTQYLGPKDGKKERARTGDGMLFQVTVKKRGPDVFLDEVSSVPLNTYFEAGKGLTIAPTQWFVDQGPEAWKDYFRQRLAVQTAWQTPREWK